MPRKLPPHVEMWRDRHGRLRVYFRKGKGARIPLPSICSPEFKEAYAAALADYAGAQKRRAGAKPGTIDALIQSYYASPEFCSLRATSKAGYRSRIEAIREAHGHRTLRA
jgi:enterobacteria phage integrase